MMVIINDKNETYVQLELDNEEEFHKIMDFFTIKIPGAEFMPTVKMGLSSGTEKFITPKGEILYGLADKLIKFCSTENIEVQDNRTKIEPEISYEHFLKFVSLLNLPFDPYPHQIKGAFEMINKKRVITLAATGSGKSCIIYIVMRYMIFKEFKTMLIVPTIDLVNQMFTDFEDYFNTKLNKLQKEYNETNNPYEQEALRKDIEVILSRNKMTKCLNIEDNFARIFGGQDKHTPHICKISTYQSLSINQNRVDPEYFEDVDAVIVDETHKASGESIQNILKCCYKASFKVGCSGSLSDNILENLKIEGNLGQVVKIVSMRELIDLGLATEIIIRPVFLQYSNELRKDIKKMNYQEQDKFIRLSDPRSKFIARLAGTIKNKNKMIIYKNIDSAELLLENIVKLKDPNVDFKVKDYRKQNNLQVYYSQGNTKSVERNNFRQYLEEADDCILLGGQKIVATGINIKKLHCIIFENIGKSLTLIQQALGRGARLHESKVSTIIFDIVDDARYYSRSGKEYPNYSFKHWMERLDVYYQYEYIVDEPIYFKLSEDII